MGVPLGEDQVQSFSIPRSLQRGQFFQRAGHVPTRGFFVMRRLPGRTRSMSGARELILLTGGRLDRPGALDRSRVYDERFRRVQHTRDDG